jgi:hypothetical protein
MTSSSGVIGKWIGKAYIFFEAEFARLKRWEEVVDMPTAPEERISLISSFLVIKPPAMMGMAVTDWIRSMIFGKINPGRISTASGFDFSTTLRPPVKDSESRRKILCMELNPSFRALLIRLLFVVMMP